MKRVIALCVLVAAAGSASAQLWNNGPFITHPGSPSTSRIETGGTTLGTGAQQPLTVTGHTRLAEDFTVPAGPGWNVTSATFFAYQTGASATAPSTITAATVALYSGDPLSGGTLLVPATSVPFTSTFTGVFRTDASGTGTTRPIFNVVANLTALPGFSNLAPGTYYLGWGLAGSLASGPWAVPVTPQASANGILGNSRQNTSPTGWAALPADGTAGLVAPSMTFILDGTVVPAPGTTALLGLAGLAAARRRRH